MNVATEQCTCPLYHGIQMGRNILCPIHGDARDTGIIDANARLIAAAPEMFRILKELLMPCPPEYAEATEQRIKALIERVES